ncbi:MAG: hypothetical protein J5698_04955 [Bacteroidaceae bacterium]|nr:hypothetical protein [Bacteroidaceae bacterium]
MKHSRKSARYLLACAAALLVSTLSQAQEPFFPEEPDSIVAPQLSLEKEADSLANAPQIFTEWPDSIVAARKAVEKLADSLSSTLPPVHEDADSLSAFRRQMEEFLLTDTLSHDNPLSSPDKDNPLPNSEKQAAAQIVSGTDTLAILDGTVVPAKKPGEGWSPDPSRATWSAIAFPGGGQIYNRKYWKLPIVYGGFLGCVYALNWNNQMYSDYSQAYLDIMDDDDKTASYLDMLPPTYNVEANKEYLKSVFKHRKDRYRRYRDMSIFCFVGVYLISVIDAYVDAELSHFDISDDLALRVKPSSFHDDLSMFQHTQGYGLQCSINF